MKLLKAQTYCKPELFFRPTQLIKRLLWSKHWRGKTGRVTLPWGLEMDVDAGERIGESITKIGVYDLVVLEALMRLADPGETCLDIGANEGLMTGMLATAIGKEGTLMAFEPHPEIFAKLSAHVAAWTGLGKIDCQQIALSNEAGTATLSMPAEFVGNRGTASLEETEGQGIEVMTARLDDVLGDEQKIGVMKIDVEGHELSVFQGAEKAIAAGRIRDIIFEEHAAYPSDVSQYLEDAGYCIFLLHKGLFGPALHPANTPPAILPNYLATLDVSRAMAKFKAFGYKSL
jgi:FkbM family methyltransferase